jgi:urease accessory protein
MDSFFPVGAFAYSDGLETATTSRTNDPELLAGWLQHYVESVFIPCDGLALLKCARAIESKDWAAIRSLDEELTAMKPAAAVRASSISIGKRLLATYTSMFSAGELLPLIGSLPRSNAAIAYAIVFSDIGLDRRASLHAYGYARLCGIVSAALRLMPLGQLRGQALLSEVVDSLPGAVERILGSEAEPLRAFAPRMDIQQMNHQYIYSRLFRS